MRGVDMWQQVFPQLEPEFAVVTSSVWAHTIYPGFCIGIMRPFLLSPPWLWMDYPSPYFASFRRSGALLTQLQEQLGEATIFAEAEGERNKRFLLFSGFTEKQSETGEIFYERSI